MTRARSRRRVSRVARDVQQHDHGPAQVIFQAKEFTPDVTKAKDVFAFMLIPEAAFLHPDDDEAIRDAVEAAVRSGKRDILLEWFRHAEKG